MFIPCHLSSLLQGAVGQWRWMQVLWHFFQRHIRSLCPFPLNLGGLVNASTNTMRQKWCYVPSEARSWKCHAAPPWSLGTLSLWMFPLQTQLSCWEKSKPHGEAMCRFSSQQSSGTQPSSHHSPETSYVSEGASPDDPGLRPEAPPAFAIIPHCGPRQVWSRIKLSLLCPLRILPT